MEDRNATKASSPTYNEGTAKIRTVRSTSADVRGSSDPCEKIKGEKANKGNAEEEVISMEKNDETNATTRLKSKMGNIEVKLKEYCNYSGLHGVRYLSEDHRNVVEKLFWFVALSLCVAGCTYMIIQIKEKLDTTPVIVTFAESPTNVWHVPFPAVTICPLIVSPQRTFNFSKFSNLAVNSGWFPSLKMKKYFIRLVEDIIRENSSDSSTEFLWEDLNREAKEIVKDDLSEISDDKEREERKASIEKGWLEFTSDYKMTKEMRSELYGDKETEKIKSWVEKKLNEFTSDGGNFSNLTLGHNANFLKDVYEYYEDWRNKITQKINAIWVACDTSGDYRTMQEFHIEKLNESALNFLKKIAPVYTYIDEEAYFAASWKLNGISANDSFSLMWAREGLCLTFNMIDNKEIFKDQVINQKMFPHRSESLKDWDSNFGYSPTATLDAFPRRPSGVGKETGFFMQLTADYRDYDYLCRGGDLSYYRIILHRPEDLPQSKRNKFVDIPPGKDVSISIKPNVMTISPGLESYSAEKRQCYFSTENHLKYFKFYSENNCELECLTNATLEKCGCVAFYMPRNASTEICGIGSLYCMGTAASALNNLQIQSELEKVPKGKAGTLNLGLKSTVCGCLPTCASISYDADVTLNEVDIRSYFTARKLHTDVVQELTQRKWTNLWIFFESQHFIASRRSELYGITEFLANCGGILSLFCGFSIVSLVEFVYFLTLRPASNIYQRRTTARKIHQNSVSPKNTCLKS